ncbi:MBL fold metallo-hydrolase [Planctomycetota bacterium]
MPTTLHVSDVTTTRGARKVIAFSLQSGSNGNCLYVETDGTRLLFDAGISGIEAERRLAGHGRMIVDVDAVILSHEHGDHCRAAGVYSRKYGLPVYVTPTTLQAINSKAAIPNSGRVRHFSAGDVLRFGSVRVETLSTAHDAVDGVAFVVADGRRRLGILTDLGHPFDELSDIVESLDAMFLESNYDPDMLRSGPYPWWLKTRIMSDGGHLSNEEAAQLVAQSGKRFCWVCLAHLSEKNNAPGMAVEAHRRIAGHDQHLSVAPRYSVGELLRVERARPKAIAAQQRSPAPHGSGLRP